MKHCHAIDIEVTPTGAIFHGQGWPVDINVMRELLDYPPGPHVYFGRYGVLRFTANNGYAVYRKIEDAPGGWNYRLVEESLKAAPGIPAAAIEPQPAAAESKYRHHNGTIVTAFQWQPHAVPPVALPEWFMRADFEHSHASGGDLVIRQAGAPAKAAPGDWIVRDGNKIAVAKAAAFAKDYTAIE